MVPGNHKKQTRYGFQSDLANAFGLCLLFAGTGVLVPLAMGTISLGLGLGLMAALLPLGIAFYAIGARKHQKLEEEKEACEEQLKTVTRARQPIIEITPAELAALSARQSKTINFAERLQQEKAAASELTAAAQR